MRRAMQWILLGLGVGLAACAATTNQGAIGVSRQQLLLVSDEKINREAAAGFAKLSEEARRAGKLNNDAALTTRVRGIGNRLIQEVGVFRPEAKDWAWEINVFDSPELNAFCAPGGKIGFFSGIIRRLQLTDDEIAAIMGHEIAHALREHSREKVSQQQLTGLVAQGASLAGVRGVTSGLGGMLAGTGTQLLLHLPFSRAMESEADTMGLELMARAGYDPRAASNVWRKMMQANASRPAEFFSTHPNPESRIQALDAAVPRVLPLYEARAKR